MANKGKGSQRPPVGKGGAQRTPELVLAQRIDQVYAWFINGARTENIYRMVAKAYYDEVLAAAKYQEAVERNDTVALQKLNPVPTVWRNRDGEKPHTRTIDAYLHKAKKRLEAEAAQRAKDGDLVVGTQHARLSDLYSRCVAGGAHMTALAIVQEVNRMHGLHGALKLEVSGANGKPIQHEDVTQLDATEAAAVAELRAILRAGAARAGIALDAPLAQL